MYSFRNDYGEGAHPRILKALSDTNLLQAEGYGEDRFCVEAARLIKAHLGETDADVHFFSGGTQTNLVTLSALLRPHEAVISAHTGHVLVHETGAIEATGHKVIAIESEDGKICPDGIQAVLDTHTDEHMVKPRLVYISDSTEIGSIYSKAELKAIKECCVGHDLLLFMDGARLGSALCSDENDLCLADIAALCDAFYIGGTKNGALLGEALVISNAAYKKEFRYHMKQKGALLAKGRLLGLQFVELFKDGLFFELASHANRMARKIRDAASVLGFWFLTHSASNQIFPILPNEVISELEKDYSFYVWAKAGKTHSAIRLVTSWATDEAKIDAFIGDMTKAAQSVVGL